MQNSNSVIGPQSFPRVAVAVIVTFNQRVLFGQRRLSENDYEWQLPGGWINLYESPDQAARREVLEETGLSLTALELVVVTNNIFPNKNHSISLCFEAECREPEKLMRKEPDKCLGWHWKEWGEVEEKLFLPLANIKKTDYRPFIQDTRVAGFSF